MPASRPMTKNVPRTPQEANRSQKRWTASSGTARRARSSRRRESPWMAA